MSLDDLLQGLDGASSAKKKARANRRAGGNASLRRCTAPSPHVRRSLVSSRQNFSVPSQKPDPISTPPRSSMRK